jgi:hypothetical protein
MSAQRELTREERAAVHKLVTKECANYSRDYGCLPLDSDCYMLGKCWTGGYCKHFLAAVLPLDPVLYVALTGKGADMRPCAFCGSPFRASRKRLYCSAGCAGKAQRRQQREHMRKKRV